MGAWGYLPFQNDSILDDLGGFLNPLRIKNALESALNCEYYYGSYEVAALLSCTYEQGITDKYIIVKEETYNLLKLLNKEKLTNSDRQLLCESNMAWISACAMDLQSRQDMLTKSCTQLYQLIHNPKLASHYPDKDKEELINNMKLVYKTAKKIIDDGFLKPIFIPNIMYNKLENNYKKLRLLEYGDKDLEVLLAGNNKFMLADHYKHRALFNEQELISLIQQGRVRRPDKHDGVMFMALNKYFDLVDKQKKPVAQAICIDKVYKGNKITHYVIQDLHGRQACVETEVIKDAMINHGLLVKNLKVTSDNRIISVRN